MGRAVKQGTRKVDLLVVFMIGAMALAIGSSWVLNAAGGKVPEVYDDPLERENGQSLHHVLTAPRAVKVNATRD